MWDNCILFIQIIQETECKTDNLLNILMNSPLNMPLEIPVPSSWWSCRYQVTMLLAILSTERHYRGKTNLKAYQNLTGFGPWSTKGFNTAYATFTCLPYVLETVGCTEMFCFPLGCPSFQVKALAVAAWLSDPVSSDFIQQAENLDQKTISAERLPGAELWKRGTNTCYSWCGANYSETWSQLRQNLSNQKGH